MINWSSNDVRCKNIIDKDPETQTEYLALGKLISLGFLYWLQTEAPRDDGVKGYPELALRPDIMGTKDGFSKHPYIRESRRAQTKYTVVEQDIAATFNDTSRAKIFSDSVGIGLYPIDIHGHEEIPGAGQEAKPFQIPLGSLIPKNFNGLLPSCKNIGVTHITNGAYRLHPIEWAIGEAQGALSFYCLKNDISPENVFYDSKHLQALQKILVNTGTPIYWFDDLTEVRTINHHWMKTYNEERPHESLNNQSPIAFLQTRKNTFMSDKQMAAPQQQLNNSTFTCS